MAGLASQARVGRWRILAPATRCTPVGSTMPRVVSAYPSCTAAVEETRIVSRRLKSAWISARESLVRAAQDCAISCPLFFRQCQVKVPRQDCQLLTFMCDWKPKRRQIPCLRRSDIPHAVNRCPALAMWCEDTVGDEDLFSFALFKSYCCGKF